MFTDTVIANQSIDFGFAGKPVDNKYASPKNKLDQICEGFGGSFDSSIKSSHENSNEHLGSLSDSKSSPRSDQKCDVSPDLA